MGITADEVRELAARGEGTSVDFKAADYDWATGKANPELAKDLIAMANSLRASAAPAYVLIGVENSGVICGVSPSSHLDDANLHKKVQNLLNRTPRFEYAPVEVDGMSVGVYTIHAGGRPFFPLRDTSPLRRHMAVFRDGTATSDASPTMILEWAREDDPEAHRLKSLELRRLEAEARVFGRLASTAVSTGHTLTATMELQNMGRSGIFPRSGRWRVEWTDEFHKRVQAAGRSFPPDYVSPGGDLDVGVPYVSVGGKESFRFVFTYAAGCEAAQVLGVPGFSTEWVRFHLDVLCESELGGEDVLRWIIRG